MAADLTKSIPHRLHDLVVTGAVEDFLFDTALAVTVPTIADAETDSVAVAWTGVDLGDSVIAADPIEALPTDCLFHGAYVSDADEVTFTFSAKEGSSGVTGAAKDFTVIIADRT